MVQINFHFYWRLLDIPQWWRLPVFIHCSLRRLSIVALPILLWEEDGSLTWVLILDYFLVNSMHHNTRWLWWVWRLLAILTLMCLPLHHTWWCHILGRCTAWWVVTTDLLTSFCSIFLFLLLGLRWPNTLIATLMLHCDCWFGFTGCRLLKISVIRLLYE